MSNKKLIYGFHAVNARLFQNPKSLLELYIATGRQDARMRDAILKAESEGIRILSVDSARLARLAEHAVVLHPGPMNRGLEISAPAADSPRSVIVEQVANGVSVRMAVLYLLLAGESAGAPTLDTAPEA